MNPNSIQKHPNLHTSVSSNLAPLVNILEGQGRQPPTSSQQPATNLKPAASHQPPAASRLHTTTIYSCSHLNFDFLTYNLCINKGRVEGGGRSKEEGRTHKLSSLQIRNYVFFHLQEQLFNRYARLSSFLGCKDTTNLRISRTVRFILPFIFSLCYE